MSSRCRGDEYRECMQGDTNWYKCRGGLSTAVPHDDGEYVCVWVCLYIVVFPGNCWGRFVEDCIEHEDVEVRGVDKRGCYGVVASHFIVLLVHLLRHHNIADSNRVSLLRSITSVDDPIAVKCVTRYVMLCDVM